MKRWALSVLALAMPWPAVVSGASATDAPAPIVLDRPRSEPAVAIDPRDPRVIVVAANPTYRPNARGEEPAGIFISRDGGMHWDHQAAPLLPPYTIASDPSVSFTPAGTLYVAYEAVPGSFCGSAGRTAVLLTRSTNAGRSFSAPTVVDSNGANDKPYMAAAAAPGNHGDAVYIAWIRFYSDRDAHIAFARSLDGGRHFSAPAILSQGTTTHVAPQVAAAPGGRVYVGWATGVVLGSTRPTQEWLESRVSTDAGARFGATGRTAAFWGLPGLEAPGSLRLFNGPSLAAGPRGAYMTWAEAQSGAGVPLLLNGNVQAAVALSRSADGVHWSAPIMLNHAGLGDRFEPQIAVAGAAVLVLYYDRRRNGRDLDLYLTLAHDGAAGLRMVKEIRVTAAASPLSAIPFIPPGSPCLAQGRFFGDYVGLAALGDQAALAWTASSFAYPGQTDVRALVSPISTL